MSDSNLKLPSTTELEVRVREALKVARETLIWAVANPGTNTWPLRNSLQQIIRILEDGRS